MVKSFWSVSVILLLIALLVGCAAPAPAPTPAPAPAPAPAPKPTTTPAPTPAPTPKPAPAPAPTPAPHEKVTIGVIDTSTGGTTWTWYTAMALLAERHSPWLRLELMPSKGYGEALYFLLNRRGHIASTGGLNVRNAMEGLAEYEALGKRPDIRLLSNLSLLYVHAIVREESSIKAFTYEEIKGKTVATREPGGLGPICAVGALEAIGIDVKEDIKLLHMKSRDMNSALLDGTADMLLSHYGIPYPLLEELFTTKDCRLISIPKEVIEKAEKATKVGLQYTVLPAGIYKGQTEPVETGRDYGLTVASEAVDEDVIYELTRLWWEYEDERNEVHPTIPLNSTVENLQAVADVMSDMQFHRGAMKYYQERGWFK
ncbi:TAXI family TRAP transporter solute-binding subunit [Chloroflexota bacterium]